MHPRSRPAARYPLPVYTPGHDRAEARPRLRRGQGGDRCAAWRGSRDRCAGCGGWSSDEAYCIDVLTQIAAVEKALDGVAVKLLADHTSHCVRDAVARGGAEAATRRSTS